MGTLPEMGAAAVVMGSYSLTTAAARMGWRPGAFLDNLDFVTQRERWGERMLNHGGAVHPFGDVPFQREPFFMRPVADTKALSGTVLDWGEYEAWRDRVRHIEGLNEDLTLRSDTQVLVSSRREVWTEARTWVVGGRVMTASGYRLGTTKRYSPPTSVDPHTTDFAQECADLWSPNDAYVLDVAETPDGMRIVEVNCLNSAGFYLGDMGRVIDAIGDLP